MPTGRSKSNASDPFAVALRLLNRRDHSEAELRQKLQQRGFDTAAVAATLTRCRSYNYIDDQRYALERARSLMRQGRGVGRKILLDLRHRGINDKTAGLALAQVSREFDSDQILRDLLERRFPDFTYLNADHRQRRRVVTFLQRRGFSLEQIFAAIKAE